MTTKKGLGETVLGWFVVREGDDGQEGASEAPAEKPQKKAAPPPGPAPARPPAPAAAAAPAPARPAPPPVKLKEGAVPPVAAGTTPDAKVFAQVYRSADISDVEQERVEKAVALLQSLPAETPREVKKQIVEASMKAFGIPVDEIIEAGVGEIQALDAFIKHGERHTQEVLGDAAARVQKLENEIAEVRRLMDLQVSTQQGLARASNEQKLRVQSVLEFFGQEAVARVVKASPKLVEVK
jgi:pyruvate/2-oxoglutarate dehydrogenase complex dihydrolipoamide acyltransferase (E2) component